MAIAILSIVAPVIGFALMLVTAAFWRLGAFVGKRILPVVIVIAALMALPGYGLYLEANPAPWRCYEDPRDGSGGCGFYRGDIPEGMIEVPPEAME